MSPTIVRSPLVPALCAIAALAVAAEAQPLSTRPASFDPGATYDAPFVVSTNHDPAVPTPDALLGFPLGTRPANHAEVERCLRAWEATGRLTLHEYARTHEQRALYYAVITSPRIRAALPAIREKLDRLTDPRSALSDADSAKLIEDLPAVAWLAYSIHGDEMSSTDAALYVIYHLIACRDADVAAQLDSLIVCVDPLMNPDGRDRYIRQLAEFAGHTPSLDNEAMQHAGRWPYGRGNHYLFDMNRDWLAGVQPETRGRWQAVAQWRPQLFVDAHEMDGYDTYLFNPPREPINPHVLAAPRKWWSRFAADQAVAFDRFGWSYYTREWLDFWYPGYSDMWASLRGATGMLYEQARVGGSPIRQPTGRILTYREAVHHGVVSSLANLHTLAAGRKEMLADFRAHFRAALQTSVERPARTFLMPPSANAARQQALLQILHDQGVEIEVAAAAFPAGPLIDALAQRSAQRDFPAGTFIVRLQQPIGPLVGALLDFDPRMQDSFVAEERRELETKHNSRIYDISAWSLPLAFGVDACWVDGAIPGTAAAYQPAPAPPGQVEPAERAYAYAVDSADDASCRALVSLLYDGLRVRVGEESFFVAGRRFGRGSLLIRVHENADANNPEDLARLRERLQRAAHASGVTIHAAATGRSPDDVSPDLGGQRFALLERPRAALLGGPPVDESAYGAIWHLFDAELGAPLSLLNATEGGADLRRYNVLILPGGWNDDAWPPLDELKTWVEAGGTLVAIGSAVRPFVSEKAAFSAVRLRPDVLGRLKEYAAAVELERSAGATPFDARAVWGDAAQSAAATSPAAASAPSAADAGDDDSLDDARRAALDEWRSVFSPDGVIVRGEFDRAHWLTFGLDPDAADLVRRTFEQPVFFAGSRVLLARRPVQTPVRLAPPSRLRLSGLLWPEAAARMGDSAYVTVERIGAGQLILFNVDPNFRGFWQGTRRLLINAVLLGPGCGASVPTAQP